jgi:hypothetical protein
VTLTLLTDSSKSQKCINPLFIQKYVVLHNKRKNVLVFKIVIQDIKGKFFLFGSYRVCKWIKKRRNMIENKIIKCCFTHNIQIPDRKKEHRPRCMEGFFMKVKDSLIILITLLVWILSEAVFALEIAEQKNKNEDFRIYNKKFIDKRTFTYSRSEVTIKILLKTVPETEDNTQLTEYFFNILDTILSERRWTKSRYSRNKGRYEFFDAWQTWAGQLPVDIEIAPDSGMDIKMKDNLEIWSYVYLCDQDKLWNKVKYRDGGKFNYKERGSKVIYFTKEKELKEYFRKVIDKANNCILEKFTNLDEQ